MIKAFEDLCEIPMYFPHPQPERPLLMSFTVQITATVASLADLTALFSGGFGTRKPKTEAKTDTKSIVEPIKAEAPKDKPKADTKSIVEPIKTEAKVEPKPAESNGGLAYPVIAQKIADLVKKDRAAAVALLTKFGVKKGPELTEAQWPAFDAEVTAALAAESSLA